MTQDCLKSTLESLRTLGRTTTLLLLLLLLLLSEDGLMADWKRGNIYFSVTLLKQLQMHIHTYGNGVPKRKWIHIHTCTIKPEWASETALASISSHPVFHDSKFYV